MKKRKVKKIFTWVIIGLILLGIGFLFTIPLLVTNQMANGHVDFEKVWQAEEFGLEAGHFFVETEDGLKISAWKVSAEKPKAIVICLSGIHNPSATAFFGHARMFREHNYSTILFDMRAHGQSEGDVICLGYREPRDTRAIVKHIKSDPGLLELPIVVFGLSMGGVTAINSMAEIPEIDALVSLSAYSAWEDIFYENMARQAPPSLAKTVKAFVPLAAVAKYRVNVWKHRPKKAIEKLSRRPALLMHSKEDTQVSFANFERIMHHAPAHAEAFVREGDNHFVTPHFTEPEKDTVYAEKLLAFLEGHFGAQPMAANEGMEAE